MDIKKWVYTFFYADLIFPFLCLYALPALRIKVEKIVNNSLNYWPLIFFTFCSFLSFAFFLSVMIQRNLNEKKNTENISFFTIGILVIILGELFLYLTSQYLFFLYSIPYSSLYAGICLYLEFFHIWNQKSKK